MFFRGDNEDRIFECNGLRVELYPDIVYFQGSSEETVRVDCYRAGKLAMRFYPTYSGASYDERFELAKRQTILELTSQDSI